MRNHQNVSSIADIAESIAKLKSQTDELDTTIKRKEKEITDLRAALAALPTDEEANKAIRLYQNDIVQLEKSKELAKSTELQASLKTKKDAVLTSNKQMEKRVEYTRNIETIVAEIDELRKTLFSLFSEPSSTKTTPGPAVNLVVPQTNQMTTQTREIARHENPAPPQLKPEDIAKRKQTSSIVTENSEIAFINLFSSDAIFGEKIKVTGGIFLSQLPENLNQILKHFKQVQVKEIDFSLTWISAGAKRNSKKESEEWKKIYQFCEQKNISVVRHQNTTTPPGSSQSTSLQESFASARSSLLSLVSSKNSAAPPPVILNRSLKPTSDGMLSNGAAGVPPGDGCREYESVPSRGFRNRFNDSVLSIPESKSESVMVLPQITTEKAYIIDQRSFFAKLFRLNQLEKMKIIRLTPEKKCGADLVYTIEYDNKKLFLENGENFSSQIKNTYGGKPKSFWRRHFPRFFKSEVLLNTVPEILEYVQKHPNKNLVESFSEIFSNFIKQQQDEEKREQEQEKEQRKLREALLETCIAEEDVARKTIMNNNNNFFKEIAKQKKNADEQRRMISERKIAIIHHIQSGEFVSAENLLKKAASNTERSSIMEAVTYIIQSYISDSNDLMSLKKIRDDLSLFLTDIHKQCIDAKINVITDTIAEKFTALVNAFCNNTLTKNMLDDFIHACEKPNIFVLSKKQQEDLAAKLMSVVTGADVLSELKTFVTNYLIPILNHATSEDATVINVVLTGKLQEDAKTLRLEITRIASTEQLSKKIIECVNVFLENFPVESKEKNIWSHEETIKLFTLINEIPYTFCNVKRVNDLIIKIIGQFHQLCTPLILKSEQSTISNNVLNRLEEIRKCAATPVTLSPRSSNSSVGTAGSDDHHTPTKKPESPPTNNSSAFFRVVGRVGITGIGGVPANYYKIVKP